MRSLIEHWANGSEEPARLPLGLRELAPVQHLIERMRQAQPRVPAAAGTPGRQKTFPVHE